MDIPYVQQPNVSLGQYPLPCAVCDDVTAQEITVTYVSAIVGILELSFRCRRCRTSWTARLSFVEEFYEHNKRTKAGSPLWHRPMSGDIVDRR